MTAEELHREWMGSIDRKVAELASLLAAADGREERVRVTRYAQGQLKDTVERFSNIKERQQ